MKFERLNYSNGKKMFLYGVIVTLILVIVINLFTSKAKYRLTQSIPLVTGTINYKVPDLNVVAVYIKESENEEYNSTDVVPTKGYILNADQSYCTTPDKKEKHQKILDYKDNKLIVDITKKGTKCYLYFDKIIPSYKTLTDLNLEKSVEGCPEIINGIVKVTEMETSKKLICSAPDDDGESYYFRGQTDNNWVKFGKDKNSRDIWWRIIRINGDGTIRLIYSGVGTTPQAKGTTTQLSGTSTYNNLFPDNTYVGYYYGAINQENYEKTHTNAHPSTIAEVIEKWFAETQLNSTYLKYIDEDAGFCNDRKTMDNVANGYGALGYGSNATSYAPWGRMHRNNKWLEINEPTFKCSGETTTKNNFEEDKDYIRDYYTWKDNATRGNRSLNYPVGLITSDEAIFAGGFGGKDNSNYWLCTGQAYWTMSPTYYSSEASVFHIYASGGVGTDKVNYGIGVRPVINLKADTQFTTALEDNKGTISNPYVVV